MKPLADHGTTARAKGRPSAGIPGCNCRPCRDAGNRYDKRRRYLNATGRTLTLPVEPIAQHLDTLFANDAGWVQLAAITKTSQSSLSRIRRRLQPVVHRDVAARILAVQPGDAAPAGRRVPAAGAVRRIQALMSLAHSVKDISAASKVEHSTISDLLNNDRDTITRHVADRIAHGYRTLAPTRGNSARSRNRAARNNWRDPQYWEDTDRIDDPNFDPDKADQPKRRLEVVAEDAEWLLQNGCSRWHVSKRLGVSEGYLDKSLRATRTA
jgi:hypothetical protein